MNELAKVDFTNLTQIEMVYERDYRDSLSKQKIIELFGSKKGKRRKVVNWATVTQAYIEALGDHFETQVVEVHQTGEAPITTGIRNSIGFHFANETPEWKSILRPRIKNWFIRNVGTLVLHNKLKAFNVDKLK